MLSSWMLYAVAVSSLIAVAALAVERALGAGGRPVRWIWCGALALSVAVPALAWSGVVGPAAAGELEGLAAVEASGVTFEVLGGAHDSRGTAWAAALDPALRAGWVGGSAFLVSLLALSCLQLARRRRRWPRARLEDEIVRVSDSLGPAVVGLVKPEIVVPRWVVAEPEERRRWILAHEREHLSAGDPFVGAAALLLVAVLPWNLPLWWMAHRLGIAIELDCDGRVLRGRGSGERKAYGSLLIEVGRRRSDLRAAPAMMAAFAEGRSGLARRIRRLAEGGRRLGAAAVVAWGTGAVLLVAAACTVPEPERQMPTEPGEAVSTGADAVGERDAVRSSEAYTRPPALLNENEIRDLLRDAYPPILRDAGIGGIATVHVAVGVDGSVEEVAVDASSGHGPLDEAAVRVARAMRFDPAMDGDRPVRVWVAVPLEFAIPTVEIPAPRESTGAAQARDEGAQPTFTPYTRAPVIQNREEVTEALKLSYPPMLREAGIAGRVLVYFFIDEEGRVQDVRVNQSSGHEALDEAALRVGRSMRFAPAFNRDRPVPVWISIPITFETD